MFVESHMKCVERGSDDLQKMRQPNAPSRGPKLNPRFLLGVNLELEDRYFDCDGIFRTRHSLLAHYHPEDSSPGRLAVLAVVKRAAGG